MIFKNEKAFQTAFGNWLKKNWHKTAAFELKLEKGGTFNVKQWVSTKGHQPRSLLASKRDGLYHKISDQSSVTKPFDCFFFYRSEAYLVIFWNKYNKFTMISIEKLLPFFEKSIRHDEAIKMDEKHGEL